MKRSTTTVEGAAPGITVGCLLPSIPSDDLGLHVRVGFSRLNTLPEHACCLRFILGVTAKNARLAIGLCAPDFPSRTSTGKSPSAFMAHHSAPTSGV